MTTVLTPLATTPEQAFDMIVARLKKGSAVAKTVSELAAPYYSQERDPEGFSALVKLLRNEVKKPDGLIRGVECGGDARFSLR